MQYAYYPIQNGNFNDLGGYNNSAYNPGQSNNPEVAAINKNASYTYGEISRVLNGYNSNTQTQNPAQMTSLMPGQAALQSPALIPAQTPVQSLDQNIYNTPQGMPQTQSPDLLMQMMQLIMMMMQLLMSMTNANPQQQQGQSGLPGSQSDLGNQTSGTGQSGNKYPGTFAYTGPGGSLAYTPPGGGTAIASSTPDGNIAIATKNADTPNVGKVCKGQITSEFGWRNHPITGNRKFHKGVDIAAAQGTNVGSMADGVVVSAKDNKDGYGKKVVVKHSDGTESVYAHLSEIKVQEGMKVGKGQQIGDVGSTGHSTGPHLHFEVKKNGEPVDPKKYLNA